MKVIIIGAVAAGSKSAARLKRLQPNWEVVIYTMDTNIAYSECGLPYYIAGSFSDVNKLIIRTPENFEKNGIKVFTKHKVVKILPNEKSIIVKNLEQNSEFLTSYDKLIIATGASPRTLQIENSDLENIFTLRTIEDGINIKRVALQSKNAVILGGGFSGIEVLEAFIKQGLKVKLITTDKNIMSNFDAGMSYLIQRHISQKFLDSVKIINEDTIVKFEGQNGKVTHVFTKNGLKIDTDIVFLSIGVRPNTEIAKDAGIELGATGAIKVNSKMETNIKDIYACGDCVEKYHRITNSHCWLPLGSTANKEGRCCATNVAGEISEFEGVLGSAVTTFFDYTMSMTGLTETMAKKYGFNPISATIIKNDKAGYIPTVGTITVKMVADKDNKRILGVQGLGNGDVDKRVNTITTALLSKMTIKEFFNNDITYSPIISTSIDPMLTVTQSLMQKLGMH